MANKGEKGRSPRLGHSRQDPERPRAPRTRGKWGPGVPPGARTDGPASVENSTAGLNSPAKGQAQDSHSSQEWGQPTCPSEGQTRHACSRTALGFRGRGALSHYADEPAAPAKGSEASEPEALLMPKRHRRGARHRAKRDVGAGLAGRGGTAL